MGECVKRFIVFLLLVFCSVAHAETETINWYMGDNIYATTTCESGGDITLPTTPTKYGYTFQGWKPNYTQIEYLESTGTQWIDTGVEKTLNSKYKFITRISFNNTTTRQLNGAQGYIYFGVISGHYQIAQMGDSYRDIIAVPNAFADCEIEFDCPNNTVSFDINNSKGVANNIGYTGLYPQGGLYLFNLDNKGFPCSEKIAYFKIYKDDVLVRDMIPVLDPNGVPCMYDRVEQKYYYNAGTGDFIAGPVIGG